MGHLVAAKLGWSEKLSGAAGGVCDVNLSDYEIKELLSLDASSFYSGEYINLEPAQVELLNPHVSAVLDTDAYSYAVWLPDETAPFGC